MDRLTNQTTGTNGTGINAGQNCTTLLDKILVTTPSLLLINQELRWVFSFHTYFFGFLFFVLSFYTLYSIFNLRSYVSRQPFITSINIFLFLFGLTRSSSLIVAPYHVQEQLPKLIVSTIWDIGFPCLTSAFCLIQLAFLELTQLKIKPEILQKRSHLRLVISSHFSCVIASDAIFALYNHFITKYIVQTVFVIWSILLYISFLYAGYKIMQILKAIPTTDLIRDYYMPRQKGIMELAILAPYNNLAGSVAAALVPTLFSQKFKLESNTSGNDSKSNPVEKEIIKSKEESVNGDPTPVSTVPEVYVRPPTPTPAMNLPIITVSSPSRRTSIANSTVNSRRGSDVSVGSRRNSECSVKFINEDDMNTSAEMSSPKRTDRNIRRHSEVPSVSGSNKDLRRCSDFSHEKNRGSQFATKLRRNSDFGNRTPRRMQPFEETSRLPKVLDVSPCGSRRNSDFGGLSIVKTPESRRNSDVSYRRNSDFAEIKAIEMNRRSSDISIRTLDKSPTHYQNNTPAKVIIEKSESDSDQQDCNDKASLMNNEKSKLNEDNTKNRKKSLSWKNIDKCNEDDDNDITAGSSLLPDTNTLSGGTDFTLHAILNHIANVNRSKSDVPLKISDRATAIGRRSQIQKILNIAFVTAIFGIILCIVDIGRIFGPYGLLGKTVEVGKKPGESLKPWPWFIYQTICRSLELIMCFSMASITKQPSIGPKLGNLYSYNDKTCTMRFKHTSSLYI